MALLPSNANIIIAYMSICLRSMVTVYYHGLIFILRDIDCLRHFDAFSLFDYCHGRC